MSNRKALVLAFFLSFLVYLIPLFNVHAGWTPLAMLWTGLRESSTFSFAMVGGALALQMLAAAVLYWVTRAFRWWKGAVALACAPLAALVAHWMFLYAIPLAVLSEADSAPEHGELSLVCTVADATLAQVETGVAPDLERAREAWLILHDEWRRALLRMPDCHVTAVETGPIGSSMDQVAAGGHILFSARDGGLFYLGPGLAAPRALVAPEETKHWRPMLSEDGIAVAWIDRAPDGDTHHARRRIRLRSLSDGQENSIVLDVDPRGRISLIGANVGDGRYTLSRYPNEVLELDGSGALTHRALALPDIETGSGGFKRVDGGWVAWDRYRDSGAYRVVWRLIGGAGEVVIPRGRGIESLSVSPDGRLIALSVVSTLNIGSTKSAVFVVRTADGVEVYRRYDPKFARVRLAFVGADHLAMTRAQGQRGWVDVYKISR